MGKLIYALTCPFTEDVHYIGKTSKGMTRPLQHMSNSHCDKIAEWSNDLKILGQKPGIKILEKLSKDDDLDERERYWIQKYLNKGSLLLNSNLVNPVLIDTKLEKLLGNLDFGDISDISNFIKERRKQIGLTQPDFADKSGVSLKVLRKIEQNKTNIQLDGLLQILSMFGCKLQVVKINK